MENQLVWISPWRTMAVVAPIAFVVSYPLIGVIWIINQFASAPGRPNWMAFVLLPLAFCLVTALFAGLAAAVYNGLSGLGLRLTVRTMPMEDAAPAPEGPTAEAPQMGDPPVGEYYRF